MNILGISAFGENPAACLTENGKLVAFCQEERFTRLKISGGHFPTHAVNWCLGSRRLHLGDIGRIAVSWDCTKYPWHMLRRLAGVRMRLPLKGPGDPPTIRHANGNTGMWRYLLDHTPAAFEQRIRDHLRDAGHKSAIPQIVFVPHHLSHAYQAFYQSPFDESAVLVADGSGEENCVSAFHFTASGFRRLFHFDVPQSLGWYYGAFTAYLGFHANRDEGKLMGLAALGEARKASNPWVDRLERILRVTHDGFHLDPTLLRFGGNENHPRFTDALRHYITSLDSRLEPVRVGEMIGINGSSRHKYLLPEYVDLAWAVQDRLETALLALARRLRRESGSERLCLSGGVAMNCKANGRVLAESGVRELFVHPASSDDGAAIGAALVVASSEGGNPRNPFRHAQLGPSYSTAEIESALQASGAAYEKPSDIAEATADLVAQGKLLGWFQGGMEMGARALGGRSIIACPGDAGAKDRVNGRVKFREQWRPYSPSLTAESRHLYLEDPIDTPFMIVSRRATQLLAANAAATVHVDGSVRPQTVSGETLPLWHHLLESVGARTGHPVLLNTSMNIRSEPIVCSPYDAIRCFWGAGLDAMAIGDFLVRKTANGGRPS